MLQIKTIPKKDWMKSWKELTWSRRIFPQAPEYVGFFTLFYLIKFVFDGLIASNLLPELSVEILHLR
jgi:hypothetical protein